MSKIYLIGNAHLDPVWLWRWQEGFAEIKATFRSALDRMKEFDDFKFTSACACYYQWIEKNAPEMFEEIKQRIEEGRWEIAGGWYIQPDCNMPSGESLARHSLYSQRYFKEKFGKIAKTGYNVDSFGHNGNIPQILAKSGMTNYVFMRPGPHEKKLPGDLFYWESQDGSRVLASRIPLSYTVTSEETEQHVADVYDMAANENVDKICFYGVGNHGGEVTVDSLLKIQNMNEYKNKNIVLSTTEEYFEHMQGGAYPVVRDELQYHGKGCYTAYTKIKKDNRKCENALYSSEIMATLSNKLLGDKYPLKKLAKAWKDVMFNQFHDILCGCSIKAAYEDAAYLHGEAMTISQQVTNFACQRISWEIDTLGGVEYNASKGGLNRTMWIQDSVGTPIVVFNTLPWDIEVPIQIRTKINNLKDNNNNEIPFQIIRADRTSDKDKHDSIFVDKLPAMGYKTYHIFLNTEEKQYDAAMKCSEHLMENEFVRVEFDKDTGAIKSFYDKQKNKSICINAAVGTVLDELYADTWGHDVRERTYYRTSFEKFDNVVGVFSKPKFKIIENGAVRSAIEVATYYGESVLKQVFYLYKNEKKLRVKATILFKEKHKLLKLSFGTELKKPEAYCEIPFGYKQVVTNSAEEVGHSWMAVCDDDTGLAIINDSKYGFDVSDNTINLTVTRGAIYADHWGERDELCEYMDMDEQSFVYEIVEFEGFEKCAKLGKILNTPIVSIMETFHKGRLPQSSSFFNISHSNIVLSALKRAEDNCGFVARFYESAGKDTKNVEILLPMCRQSIKLNFTHNEIKTVKVFDDGGFSITNILEE